jgi:hypothetical protein
MNYIFTGTVLDTAILTPRVVPNAEVTVNNNLQLRTMTGNAHCGAWCSGWEVDVSSVKIKFDVTPSPQSYPGTPGTVFVLKKIGATHETTYYGWPNTCIIVYLRSGSSTASVTTQVNAAAGTSGVVSFAALPASVLAQVQVTIVSGIVKVYVNDTFKASLTLSPLDKTAIGSVLVPEWGNASYERDGTSLVNNINTTEANEQHASLRIASVAEAFRSLQLAPAARAEAWRGIQVRRAAPVEKAYEIYVDAAARLEKAAQLSVVATMGFEAFAPLLVNGTLATLEQFTTLSVEAHERMVFEAYQRLAMLGEVDSSIFEQSVGLVVDNSVLEFISFQEQGGLYYRQFDVQVNVHPDTFPPRNVQLIGSLTLYGHAKLTVLSTLMLESGPVTVVDREITLMYDGVQERIWAADQSTGADAYTATLRLVSPTAGLGNLKPDERGFPRGSRRFNKSWPSGTMASEIMDELFAGSGLSYDLRIDDFPIGQQLTVENEFPFQIWPKIFIKERARTGDDGDTLIIDRGLPCLPENITINSTAALRAAIEAAPLDHGLDPGQYMIQSAIADDGGQIRYTMIRVANYQDSDAGAAELAAPEQGEINSSGYREIFGWPVPWREKVWLRCCHEPHDGFEFRADGVAEDVELEETISFDNGVGRTQRPIYALLSVDWMGNASLGAITPSEDGTLTAATAGKSVATVRYKTRRYKFLYRDDDQQHKMSFWLRAEV